MTAADYGLFGPDSMTWRVWGHPAAVLSGFQRAVVVEELYPPLLAAVHATGANYTRPRQRYQRTLHYLATVAFADSGTAVHAADVLVRVHVSAVGVEPVSGNVYDANDPEAQLWILLTAWHSILKVYERFGPGKLSEVDENRYWAECAIAAELQTCDPGDVPGTREDVRAYFDRMRPRLAVGEAAQDMVHHLIDARLALPPIPLGLRPMAWAMSRVIRAGTIATLPRWMLRLCALRPQLVAGALARPVLRGAHALLRRSPALQLSVLRVLAPSVAGLLEPVLRGTPPVTPVVVTPEVARQRLGVDSPAQAHLAKRAARREQAVLQ